MSELPSKRQWMEGASVTLDGLVESGLAIRDVESAFKRAFMTAVCIADLKEALTEEVMKPIMFLQGSSLGFRTDKDNPKDGSKPGYPVAVVKECLIAAVLTGLLPCGNQFNIIGGRMYITKEGFTALLDKVPGLTYTIDQRAPEYPKEGSSIVRTRITWQWGDKKGEKKLEIPVRVNKLMGDDAILGKADRKAKCWLHNNLFHTQLADGEVESEPLRDVTPRNAVAEVAAQRRVEATVVQEAEALPEPPAQAASAAAPWNNGQLFETAEPEPAFGTPYRD